MGDSSDNIPGAKGVGAKGAAKLLQDFDSIEDIYSRISLVASGSLRRKLEESEDMVRLSLSLTRLDRPLPVELNTDLSSGEPDREALLPILERLSLAR